VPKLEKVSEARFHRRIHQKSRPSHARARLSVSRRYKDWKASKDQIDAEFSKNKALGERLGCWKAGMLVDNDDGAVALALKEIE